MVDRINENNLYTKDGKLLLAAGQKLTENMQRKIEKLGYIENIDKVAQNEKLQYENDVESSTDILKEFLKIKDVQIINNASIVVENILFKSKNQPWWLYVNTVSNYIDWLYTHAIDVSILSVMLAQALNLKDLQEIALGAFLHDIGKLMIPKYIIQKPDKLTETELYLMRQHCDLGVSMATDYKLNQISLDIILQHHERLDGSGYPHGLKDKQIPQHSRIVMIADIIDAMTTYRPYKPSKQLEAAVKELKENPATYPQDIVEIISWLIL